MYLPLHVITSLCNYEHSSEKHAFVFNRSKRSEITAVKLSYLQTDLQAVIYKPASICFCFIIFVVLLTSELHQSLL